MDDHKGINYVYMYVVVIINSVVDNLLFEERYKIGNDNIAYKSFFFSLLHGSLWFFISALIAWWYYINDECLLLSISSMMKSIFLVGLSFYSHMGWTRAQLDACFANSHVTRDGFLLGDFFACRPNNQIRISFAARHMLLHPGEEVVNPRWSRRLKRYFSFVAVCVRMCFACVYVCMRNGKRGAIYGTV